MRELERLLRQSVGIRRHDGAWRQAVAGLTLAALLALGLSQPLHASSTAAAAAGPAAAFVAAGGELPAQHAAHDADLCSLCRASAQARVGLRVSACAGELAARSACLPLSLPAPELACATPDLHNAPPRAPPTLRLLSA